MLYRNKGMYTLGFLENTFDSTAGKSGRAESSVHFSEAWFSFYSAPNYSRALSQQFLGIPLFH